MGQQTPAESGSPQVVVVEVTVHSAASRGGGGDEGGRGGGGLGDGGGAGRRRVTRRRVLVATGALGVLAAIVAMWLGGWSARHRDPVSARGPAGVAAAYGYRLDCLSVTILASDRTYARADLSHAAGCGGITGYAPAIFHYVAGRWRVVPNAIGYMCNPGAVPAMVERGLNLCVTIDRGCARIGNPGQGRPAAPFGWPCVELPKIAGVV
jgi:hypothetical protein